MRPPLSLDPSLPLLALRIETCFLQGHADEGFEECKLSAFIVEKWEIENDRKKCI